MMEKVFMWTGFICLILLVVVLTLYLMTLLIYVVVMKTTSWMRVFRRLWQFYKSLEPTSFAKTCRYHLALYDKTKRKFIIVESLTDEFLSESDYEKVMMEFKQKSQQDNVGHRKGRE